MGPLGGADDCRRLDAAGDYGGVVFGGLMGSTAERALTLGGDSGGCGEAEEGGADGATGESHGDVLSDVLNQGFSVVWEWESGGEQASSSEGALGSIRRPGSPCDGVVLWIGCVRAMLW